ncbi:alpha/beta hydrolase [Haloferax volcanii]|uniref:Alpha/beta hydrolase fold protein n=3 Tax=Haloferax volcanii TaxID=2246 RepID=D4GRD6_HALVD|nr:dienelactone hydrolase family protein [Haloferax volcanii]ADE02046.1 alpha/beta hydrolase fold protein [Haloferax volcanii DS2]ELY38775.1 phospholipase/carboxylesterase [Haloferax volcanii DS2]MBS8121115.1 dienelactone hydrolase family protein [Haloferax volcanii]MBS8126126.1 dienelactone hydrolase family protein [Haloferax volcanii]MBS8129980.1 dienelactone hydrolase family protein [Haloferax volcanii]
MAPRPTTPRSATDPHEGQEIATAGAPPQVADAAVIMLHGRGSKARHVLTLVDEFLHRGVMYLAPQAAGSSWYPAPAASPIERNEPWLTSALGRVSAALDIATDTGVPPERVVFFGFSQGACLAAEFALRNPRRYGGLVALSGSLLGPDLGSRPAGDDGNGDHDNHGSDADLGGTPVFFGSGRDDPRVETDRVEASARVFAELGADATSRLYEGLGHAINDDEIRVIDSFIERLD